MSLQSVAKPSTPGTRQEREWAYTAPARHLSRRKGCPYQRPARHVIRDHRPSAPLHAQKRNPAVCSLQRGRERERERYRRICTSKIDVWSQQIEVHGQMDCHAHAPSPLPPRRAVCHRVSAPVWEHRILIYVRNVTVNHDHHGHPQRF